MNAVGYLANTNYTDVCNEFCRFCSFYATPRDSRGCVLSPEYVQARIHRVRHLPVTEIHMVGGINPALPYS